MPFGVTNGVSCFQRAMDNFIADNQLEGTFAYLDNITVSGRNQGQHDLNLNRFLESAKVNNLVFNRNKCTFSTSTIQLLGYEISNNKIRPDPNHLQPLREMPSPPNLKFQKKEVGLFSYYSKSLF